VNGKDAFFLIGGFFVLVVGGFVAYHYIGTSSVNTALQTQQQLNAATQQPALTAAPQSPVTAVAGALGAAFGAAGSIFGNN
jgi:hypothetical protein